MVGIKTSKRWKAIQGKVNPEQKYAVEDAMALVVETGKAKFDETVDVAIRLGIDPKQSDQQVRGAALLPHGLGKTIRVVVFAQGEKEREAKEAGADHVGAAELAQKIEGGWLDFDQVIATPDMMGTVGKLGKVLGPRGLMPNPKTGTVTMDVARAVAECKKGKVEFKNDKGGNLHAAIGKVSFGKDKLKDNFLALWEIVLRLKPATAKGSYIERTTVSSTMGPGVGVDVGVLLNP